FRVLDWSAFESIENVLQAICQELEQLHYITQASAVFQKLIAREALGGMGLPGTTVALHHTRSNAVLQPLFTVYRLRNPIEVQGMQEESLPIDTVLMMLAPEAVSDEALETLSFISSLLVQQKASATLFASGREKEIHQFLAFHLMQFIQRNHILEEGVGMNKEILQEENIKLNVDLSDKDEAVVYVGNMLVDAGLVNNKYIDKMLERETITSTYMGNAL